MDDIYREHIIDHYSNPRNFGDLDRADIMVKEANASCGDMFQLALKRQMANLYVSPAKRRIGRRFSHARNSYASPATAGSAALSHYARNGTWRIADIKFKGVGCAISTAAFSLLTEKIKAQGMTFEQLKQLTEQDMLGLLGIPVSPTRMKCATLPLRAIKRVLDER